MTHQALVVPVAHKHAATIYVAVELSMSSWVIGLVDPRNGKISRHQISCSDLDRLMELISRARKAAGCERVVLCYEAGRDGFWLSRILQQRGLEVLVLDPASLPVDRRQRRAKSDGLDVEMLLRAVMAHERGEPRACSVCRVPSVEEEDARRLPRERERLQSERTAHSNRIKGLLAVQGIYHVTPLRPDFQDRLKEKSTGDGRPLPLQLLREIEREVERLRLVQEALKQVEKEMADLAMWNTRIGRIIRMLMRFKGIGPVLATVLACECLYKDFANRSEIGSYSGLVPSPWRSGGIQREQGISKAGNGRLRSSMIELGWLWLQWQPNSALSKWFHERVGDLKGRIRKIAIVAMARKLLIALWKFATTGVVPEGAILAD
ncbi:IS110 family transposase [Telmatospirillum siberiense]|uniref:IS110 family transposase n=1 Tax=Telmatospirillum siberiense TaxID=382514 RepID=A0A2N3PLR6_9PROT|nr:IS110 family transposase [Telmatospirillum siberiense]PKU21338.1 IS110 family transposase [Telmatospirillum siberiense]